jgi:hypothetical protein
VAGRFGPEFALSLDLDQLEAWAELADARAKLEAGWFAEEVLKRLFR